MSPKLVSGPDSIMARIGMLMLAAILAVLAVSFLAMVVMTPSGPARMTVEEARAGLASAEAAQRAGLRRSLSATPPLPASPVPAAIAGAALADALHLPDDAVRIRLGAGAPEKASLTIGRRGKSGDTAVLDPRGIYAWIEDPRLRPALLEMGRKQRILAAAARGPDGSWTMVEPAPFYPSWRLRLFAAFALSALLLAPCAWLAARRLTRPIRALADYARSDAGGEGALSLSAEGPSEVREAAAAIAGMRARLQDQAAERTRMLAAVAHDLRTPLTGLRIRAESAPEEERKRMVGDIARMEAMIDQVLSYSAGEQAGETMERLDLAALAGQAAGEARERGGDVAFAPHGPLMVLGAPLGLHRALANLIDNAVCYAGAAEVSVREEGGRAAVAVADCGPGLPEAMLDKVREPFFRIEESRSRDTGGAGLGLAIARSVAERHKGTLVLRNREGGGLVAEMSFPNGAVPPSG